MSHFQKNALLFTAAMGLCGALGTAFAGETEIKDFITDMYNKQKFEDYRFLEQHCSISLLKKLEQAHDYDCYEDVCYAVWSFRSGVQDCVTYACETKILSITPKGDGWFTYEFLDMGKQGRRDILIRDVNGKFIIENLE